MTTVQIALRLADSQLRAIDRLVPKTHETRSDVIRRAIDLYLYRLACERDASVYEAMPLTEEELSLADSSTAWEATPRW